VVKGWILAVIVLMSVLVLAMALWLLGSKVEKENISTVKNNPLSVDFVWEISSRKVTYDKGKLEELVRMYLDGKNIEKVIITVTDKPFGGTNGLLQQAEGQDPKLYYSYSIGDKNLAIKIFIGSSITDRPKLSFESTINNYPRLVLWQIAEGKFANIDTVDMLTLLNRGEVIVFLKSDE
jgi:hypothetical protein